MTSPILSFGRASINSLVIFFAASSLFGLKSSASIEPEMSSVITISMPSVSICFSELELCGLAKAIIKKVIATILKAKGR